MAETLVIKATKFNGAEVAYIGMIGSDGYIYFNDDMFYRFKAIGTWEQNVYVLNNNRHSWMKTSLFSKIATKNMNDGSGSVAPGGNGVEGACNWAVAIAEDFSHGYDQPNRDGGVDFDCSSLVSWAFRQSGFDIPLPSPATYSMIAPFQNAGFKWLPGIANDSSNLQRGDIVLNINAHVELYLGGQQLVGACINEFGGISGGQQGDQTGSEIRVGGWYSFPWDGVLRYE